MSCASLFVNYFPKVQQLIINEMSSFEALSVFLKLVMDKHMSHIIYFPLIINTIHLYYSANHEICALIPFNGKVSTVIIVC